MFGSQGHNQTVDYIAKNFKPLSKYYNVELQPFTATFAEHFAELSINGEDQNPTTFTYSPNGKFDATPITAVPNGGCVASDFPAGLNGIALIQRGTCDFGLKVALAGSAGADAVIIYNNAEGTIAGTLGSKGPRPEGAFVPVAGLTKAQGEAILARLTAGETVNADLELTGTIEDRTTHNVIIQTKAGDQNNVIMLGSHSDSVAAGPGINDNGSGSSAVLEIATALSRFSVKNAVRFAWWSAEEFGLLGAKHYVENLPQAEKDKIRLYLNFDMIASPNYALGVHDGDGSAFGQPGPEGSAQAEKLFTDYYANIAKVPSVEVEFSGRSDYGPFLDAGIAAGGINTGAEGLKTAEEVALFGGEEGVAYDVNYHKVGDTVDNLNADAFEINAKAIAHAVATYATSFEGIGPRKRSTIPHTHTHTHRAPPANAPKGHACGEYDSI